MFVDMNRQISYTVPLPETPSDTYLRPQLDLPLSLPSTPCTLSSKPFPPVLMSHPIPPKPPVSKYFIPVSFPRTGAAGVRGRSNVTEGDKVNNGIEAGKGPLVHELDIYKPAPGGEVGSIPLFL